MDRIVVASDSFKGSLSSAEVASAAAAGVIEVFPSCIVEEVPVADGGEGMLEALCSVLGGEVVHAEVHDPLGRPVSADYLIVTMGDEKTAVIETAKSCGLTLLTSEERNPMLASTFGAGELIMDSFSRGCRNFLIGIGGSSTNDGGTGMLEALGFIFTDTYGRVIHGCCGGILGRIAAIDASRVDHELLSSHFLVACDVDTPFCGPHGAVNVFAAQKGASMEMMGALEEGMDSFAGVIENEYGISIRNLPGSGAAGGLGGALSVFLNGELKRGIDLILDAVGFDSIIRDADLIITGEGRIDSQTAKGKTPAGILKRANRFGVPVLAIGGLVDLTPEEIRNSGFLDVLPIQPPPPTPEDLMAAMHPAKTSSNICRTISAYLRKHWPASH